LSAARGIAAHLLDELSERLDAHLRRGIARGQLHDRLERDGAIGADDVERALQEPGFDSRSRISSTASRTAR